MSTSVGLIDESGRFIESRRIGVAAQEPVGIGGAGLGGEVVELVVEQHPGPLRNQAGPIGKIERIGIGDRVAGVIDDREMRRLIALIALGLAGANVGGGAGAVGRDERAQMLGVGLGDEAGERDFDEIGIAEISRAVGVGELFRFRQLVQRGGGIEALRGNRETFENIEDFNDMRPSGRGRRHRDDGVAAISPADGLALDGAIIGEILDRHSPARRIDRLDDLLRHRPGVKARCAVGGDRLERRGEIVERDVIAGLRNASVGAQIDARR